MEFCFHTCIASTVFYISFPLLFLSYNNVSIIVIALGKYTGGWKDNMLLIITAIDGEIVELKLKIYAT